MGHSAKKRYARRHRRTKQKQERTDHEASETGGERRAFRGRDLRQEEKMSARLGLETPVRSAVTGQSRMNFVHNV